MPLLTHLSATEIARLIRRREVSAKEVTEAHINRIEEVNPRINAVAFPMFEEARRTAEAADAAQARGTELGLLHGVPITIKDNFLVKGTPTTFGLVRLRDHRAAEDGPLVKRLREAGAIILGKTNIAQLLSYIESDNVLYGRTLNPWNPERTSGGSSGGEGAIVAAGGSALGFGGDYGGSIREPAHFCGIYGLKPTTHRLTNFDTPPGGLDTASGGAIVAQSGPLARSTADLLLAMQVLAAPGQDYFDPSIPPVPWRDPAEILVSGLKIAFYTDDGAFPPSPAIRRVVREAAEALRTRGATVEEWTPPDVGTLISRFFSLVTADGAKALFAQLGGEKANERVATLLQVAALPAPLRRVAAAVMGAAGHHRLAKTVKSLGDRSVSDLWGLYEAQKTYNAHFLAEMNAHGFDAIICPPSGLPAVRHGATANLPDFDSYARLYNLTGMPAGVVAAGRVRPSEESDRPASRDIVDKTALESDLGSVGLPVGVQVAARHWREDIVLSVMGALEEHFRTTPDYPASPPL
jgi:fatty acid amide hydrolase